MPQSCLVALVFPNNCFNISSWGLVGREAQERGRVSSHWRSCLINRPSVTPLSSAAPLYSWALQCLLPWALSLGAPVASPWSLSLQLSQPTLGWNTLYRDSPTKPSYHCLFQGPGSPLPRATFSVVALPLLHVPLPFGGDLMLVCTALKMEASPQDWIGARQEIEALTTWMRLDIDRRW